MTHASVFSGIGGPEVAAAMLGWENLFHCEINPFGRAVLQYWFPNSKSYEDITKTDFSEWGGRVNVLTGGFPCQPFSYAGQRRGADDDRYLWPFMHRCINQVRPDWVVCENVAGILTMVEQGDVTEMAAEKSLFDEGDTLYRYRLDETFTLERICNDLESDGYAVQAVVIPACAVNAPHRRDRVFIIGHRIVADTDNGAYGRTARKNEGESSAQRLQERHEVRQPDQPTQVRPTGADDAENAMCGGQLHGQHGVAGDKRDIRNACAGDFERLCGEAQRFPVADPNSNGQCSCCRPSGRAREKMDSRGAGKPFNGIERLGASRPVTDTTGNGSDRIATGESGQAARQDGQLDAEPAINGGVLPRTTADPSGTGLQETRPEQQAAGDRGFGLRNGNIVTDTTQQCSQRNGLEQPGTGRAQQEQLRGRSGQDCGIAGLGRWDEFPTVSPVHRGNDGFPFSLGDLTISPSKWRTESLKAYGNAIVPQVMYEILRAIEETYK